VEDSVVMSQHFGFKHAGSKWHGAHIQRKEASMRRNFEFITRLGLQVGVTEQSREDATEPATAADVAPILSSDAGNSSQEAGGEEMVRFILEMFPQSGCAPKK
jgi:hypothetical protein